MNKKLRLSLTVSYATLFLIWGILELWGVPQIAPRMSSTSLTILKEAVLKLLVWFGPALLLMRRFDEDMSVKRIGLFRCRRVSPVFFAVALLFTVFLIVAARLQKGAIVVAPTFHAPADILVAVTIGLSEEMFFRGWLLNATLRNGRKWIPLLLNSLLFLLIHFPVWIRNGIFINYMTSGLFLEIIALSLVFGWAFIKSENILVPAALHTWWDLLCFLFGL